MQPPTPIHLLIVQWHSLLSATIEEALARDPSFSVVGRVNSAVEATRFVRSGRATDLVLCESTLPEPGATELARFFRMRLPKTVIAFFTRVPSQTELFEATRVGVAAYLRANAEPRDFTGALRRAARGEFPIDDEVVQYPAVAARILQQFRRGEGPVPAPESDLLETQSAPEGDSDRLTPLFVPLSSREIEILDLVARGNSNKLIARDLGISDQTVKNHVSAILRKLEVNDRTEAVVMALRNGWIRIDSPARKSSQAG